MSAKLDTTQPVRFYYGNAARDLAHLLPADESPETEIGQLLALVESVSAQLESIEETRKEIGFLLSDLKRLLPN